MATPIPAKAVLEFTPRPRTLPFDAVDTMLNGGKDLREPAARRAERCLLSIAAALCALSGIDRQGYGASYIMSGELDWMACLSRESVR